MSGPPGCAVLVVLAQLPLHTVQVKLVMLVGPLLQGFWTSFRKYSRS